MSKQLFIKLPPEVRMPKDLDFYPTRQQVESAARRAMPAPIPQKRFKRSEVAFLVFLAVALVVATIAVYLTFLLSRSN